MKKNLLIGLTALAAITITSCQKDQVINQVPQEQAIEFGTYLGRDAMTKGSVLDTDGLKTKGFGVFAYYTDNNSYAEGSSTPNYMYNQLVTGATSNGETTWSYSPVKYWPNESTDKLSFMAYAPFCDNNEDVAPDPFPKNANVTFSENDATGAVKITYKVDSDASNHLDLTYATDANVETTYADNTNNLLNLSKGNVTDKISFTFRHALARVGFKIEAVVDEVNSESNGATDNDDENKTIEQGTTISVNSVTINGDFYNQGTLNLKEGTWSQCSALSGAHTSYTLESTEFVDNLTISNAAQQLNKASEYLMILPQKFDDDTDSQVTNTRDKSITITVKYTVTTTDSNITNSSSSITNNITSAPFEFDFQQGKAYNFVLHLGLTSVKLSATVADWDNSGNGTDIAVNVPINQAN